MLATWPSKKMPVIRERGYKARLCILVPVDVIAIFNFARAGRIKKVAHWTRVLLDQLELAGTAIGLLSIWIWIPMPVPHFLFVGAPEGRWSQMLVMFCVCFRALRLMLLPLLLVFIPIGIAIGGHCSPATEWVSQSVSQWAREGERMGARFCARRMVSRQPLTFNWTRVF